jgi:hypothetical protein
MRSVITLLVLFVFTSAARSQQANFESNYKAMLENLNNGEWASADSICKVILDQSEHTDSMDTERKVLRYIHIYATAGLLNENKVTKQEALKATEYLKGKEMMMPSHPFNSKCYVNCTHLDEIQNTFFTSVNNSAGTQIFSFEYVTTKGPVKEKKEALEGTLIQLSGVLSEISIEGQRLPRFKLRFKDGTYSITND